MDLEVLPVGLVVALPEEVALPLAAAAEVDRLPAFAVDQEVVAAVEAELDLSEITSDIRAADRLVGSGDGGLQTAEHGIHPF